MAARLNGWIVVVLLLGTFTYCLAEELTLTTYYPSPRGVYNELRTRGDVAIGKLDTPSARLEIVGGGATSATSALRIRNVDQTSLLEVQNGGNVGIGTQNPSQKLDVMGYVRGATGLCIGSDCRTGWPSSGGNGTVTSLSAGSGITLSPNPITTSGSVSVNTNSIQNRVSGTCPSGYAIRVINADGTVVCQTANPLPCTYNGHTYTAGASCYQPMYCGAGNVMIMYCNSTGNWSTGSGSTCIAGPATC